MSQTRWSIHLLLVPFHFPHQAVSSDLGSIPSFRRLLSHSLELDNDDEGGSKPTSFTTTPKKKDQTLSKVVQSKPDKPTRPTASAVSSNDNHTTKAFASSTKPIPGKNSSGPATAGARGDALTKIELKKLNSTAARVSKMLNSTAKAAHLGKKSLDLAAKNPSSVKLTKKVDKESKGLESEKEANWVKMEKKADPKRNKKILNKQVSGFDLYGGMVGDTGEDEDDLVTQFRDLPAEFHRTLLPDLERISAASKAYVGKANERIAKNIRPYISKRYASTAAAAASLTFVVMPLIIVSLIVRHMKEHLSVQRTAVFVHVYMAVYFSILCVSALLTGVEPLRFFDATSHSTYAFLQVVQMVGYMLYLLLLFLYLLAQAFTTGIGPSSKLLVLVQAVVRYAVGIHYYVMVFHRAVSHQPPKTSWKVHGVYAECFVVACRLARAAEHRRKAYLEGDGEGDKQS